MCLGIEWKDGTSQHEPLLDSVPVDLHGHDGVQRFLSLFFYGTVHRVRMKNIVSERQRGSNSISGLGEGSLQEQLSNPTPAEAAGSVCVPTAAASHPVASH